MRINTTLFSLLIAALLPVSVLAVPVFTITPMASSFSVTNGTTAEVQYDVRNDSGKTLTITNESVGQSGSTATSDAISSNSNCENSALANNADCTLDVDITGNQVGSSTIQPKICAFNGQLCSQAPTSMSIEVVAQDTFNCATNSTTKQCRVFVSAGTYTGDLTEGNAAVDTTSCQSNASGIKKGNCICEKEAAAAGYSHPGHWRVWLSDPQLNAISNIKYTAGGSLKYVRATDTETTVANANQLVGNNLQASISTIDAVVWTGTSSSDGELTITGGSCQNWSSNDFDPAGNTAAGQSNQIGKDNNTPSSGQWSFRQNNNGCGEEKRLYCFEIPG